MKRIALGLLLAGCAEGFAPPKPTPYQQAISACTSGPVRDETGVEVPFMLAVTCPFVPGATVAETDMAAQRHAVPIAVLLRREFVFFASPAAQPKGARLMNVYYSPGQNADPAWQSMRDAGIRFFRAAEAFTPAEYAALRARADVLDEDRAYAKCKALVFDQEAAVAAPEKAAACSRTMEVIDRARDRRQSQANSARLAEIEMERARIEQSAADNAAWSNFQRSIQAMRPVSTQCTTIGMTTNCTTH